MSTFQNAANSQNRNTQNQNSSLNNIINEINKDIHTALRSLKQDSNDMKDVINAFENLAQAITNVGKVIQEENLYHRISKELNDAYVDISNFSNNTKKIAEDLAKTLNRALKINDDQQRMQFFDKIIDQFISILAEMERVNASFNEFKDSTSNGLPDQLLESVNQLLGNFYKLEDVMERIGKSNPNENFNSVIEMYQKLSETVKTTSEEMETAEGKIINNTRRLLDAQINKDGGTALLFKNLGLHVDELGKKAAQNKDIALEIFNSINNVAKIDTSRLEGLNEGLQRYYVILDEIQKAQKEFNTIMSDSSLSRDQNLVHNQVVKMLALNKESYKQLLEIMDEYEKASKKKLGIEQYEKLQQILKNLVQDYNNLSQAAKLAGVSISETNSSLQYNEPKPSLMSRVSGGLLTTGRGLWGLGTGILDKSTDFAKKTAYIAGLGGVLSWGSILSGIFSQNRVYSNLEIESALYDMISRRSTNWNRISFDSAFARGISLDQQTHGYISVVDYVKNRNAFVKNIIGHYNSDNPFLDARDMNSLARMSTIYQNAYGVSQNSMMDAINTFYKEFKMDLTDTEYLITRIANSSEKFNIPFEKHLQLIKDLSTQYKNYGLNVDSALNVINNLMSKYNMSMTDAQKMASSIGSSVGNMNEGMAAFSGMMFSGFSNPFASIMAYKNRWNPDGSVREGWINDVTNRITGMADLYGQMAGGDPHVQQYLLYRFYKDELNMDEKTSVLLSQTRDSAAIEKILRGQAGTSSSSKEEAIAEKNQELINRLSEATEEMSGIDKTLNALTRAQILLAAKLDDHIEALTNFEKEINKLVGALSEKGTFAKKIDEFIKNQMYEEMLHELASILMGLAALSGLQQLLGLGKKLKKRKNKKKKDDDNNKTNIDEKDEKKKKRKKSKSKSKSKSSKISKKTISNLGKKAVKFGRGAGNLLKSPYTYLLGLAGYGIYEAAKWASEQSKKNNPKEQRRNQGIDHLNHPDKYDNDIKSYFNKEEQEAIRKYLGNFTGDAGGLEVDPAFMLYSDDSDLEVRDLAYRPSDASKNVITHLPYDPYDDDKEINIKLLRHLNEQEQIKSLNSKILGNFININDIVDDENKNLKILINQTLPKNHKEIKSIQEDIKKSNINIVDYLSGISTSLSALLKELMGVLTTLSSTIASATGDTSPVQQVDPVVILAKINNINESDIKAYERLSKYLEEAEKLGITDPKAQIYFADLYMENASRAKSLLRKVKNKNDISELHKVALKDSVFSRRKNKRKEAYETIKNSDVGLIGESSEVAKWYLDNFKITSHFGSKEKFRSKGHGGLDLDQVMGYSVLAITGGKVITAETGHKKGEPRSYGNYIDIQLPDGRIVRYAHLKDVFVKKGQTVKAGTKIGTVGNTGSVFSVTGDGSHLHLELIDKNGKKLDPEPWLKRLAGSAGFSSHGDSGGPSVDNRYFNPSGDYGGPSTSSSSKSGVTAPIQARIGRYSVYALGRDPKWNARVLYKGSIGFATFGSNSKPTSQVEYGRKVGVSNFNIYINADPSKSSQYYNQLAKVIEERVKKAQEEFARKWYNTKSLKV